MFLFPHRHPILLFALWLLFSVAAFASSFSHIVAFGDSLSSGGRGKAGPSTGPSPTPENGNYPRLTWVQQLSEMAGLGPLVKWENGGANYAIGGTTTTQLEEQVDRYLEKHGGKADPRALYAVWSGGNDLTHYLRDKSKITYPFSNFEKSLPRVSSKSARRLEKQIDRLVRAGAVHILWLNLPDLSRPPSLETKLKNRPDYLEKFKRGFRAASLAFNKRMDQSVESLRKKHPGMELISIDIHALFDRMLDNPAEFGFTDVTTPSRNSNKHLFYDGSHPTSHGHYECARYVYAQLAALGKVPPVSAFAPAKLSSADEAFVAAVRKQLPAHPFLRRHTTITALKADKAYNMKYPEKPAHMAKRTDAEWKRFALSLSDSDGAKKIANFLPAVAMAARLSGDTALRDYAVAQLTELSTWNPLQRAGWSGGSATRSAWLGTGWAVRAIVQTVALLPEGSVSPELRAALEKLFEDEIAGIREDWRTKRAWFVRIEAVSSNQWVLPLEALALASIFNGLDKHRDDYEFAIAGLLRTLDVQGPRGECVEGMLYGAITYESLLAVALAAKTQGDNRIIDHPWMRAFPVWYFHHRQPGGFVINAFDSQDTDLNWGLVAQMAAYLDSANAHWILARRPPGKPSADNLALWTANRNGGKPGTPPAQYAAYDIAARANWVQNIDAYEQGAANRVSGFWMRGGHASDAHDHQDRGHVNFIVAGRPVLIEAGLSSYGIEQHLAFFKSVAGHNVLQIGAYKPAELTQKILNEGAGQILSPEHRAAPMTVHRLDETGGKVSVDASGCYANLKRWVRTAEWDASAVTIRDEVELPTADTILFRWHLGEQPDAVVHRAPGKIQVGDTIIKYATDANVALHVAVETMPDATAERGVTADHATVVLSTAKPEKTLTLTTKIFLSK